jgi:predicted aspartyl protease
VRSFGPAAPDARARSDEVRIFGNFLDVVIRPPSGLPRATGLPDKIDARGLIDTGASEVCIDYRIAEELALRVIDQKEVGIVGATVLATIYLGVLEIPELNFSEPMRLYSLKVRRPTHDVLIGRSILRGFIVTFDGPNGMFHFVRAAEAYPPPDHDE